MITKPRVSLDEFLAMEETKPYLELIDGEVVPKAMGGGGYGVILATLCYHVVLHLRETKAGRACTQLRRLHRPTGRVYLPDLDVELGRRPVRRDIVETVPDFVIDVLSPGAYPGRVTEKIDFYLRSGVQLTWLVDPDTQTIAVYRPDRAPELFRRGQTIDAKPVLREFTLDLEALFSILDEPAEGDEPA